MFSHREQQTSEEQAAAQTQKSTESVIKKPLDFDIFVLLIRLPFPKWEHWPASAPPLTARIRQGRQNARLSHQPSGLGNEHSGFALPETINPGSDQRRKQSGNSCMTPSREPGSATEAEGK